MLPRSITPHYGMFGVARGVITGSETDMKASMGHQGLVLSHVLFIETVDLPLSDAQGIASEG